MLIPMRVEDDNLKNQKQWVIMDTASGHTNLGLQFPQMETANLYAVEHPSFKWLILGSEIGVG